MERALEHLQHELAGLRAGRATSAMLDHIKMEAYGDRVPMKQCASISVRSPQLLVITVFDPQLQPAAEKAVRDSPLCLNPRSEGQEILVPVPPPTAEALAAMRKVCKSEGEAAKVSLRHVRKVAMDAAKALASEDARRKAEKEVQTMLDRFIAEVERVVAAKQADLDSHNS
jgi:ribosome recycling factor